ncbi:hypothetical protein [Methylobacterium sp. J-070]|uniref:hypothetical protein n=1 Tax=Methylobacterium sp. J-070 TaxID=2836650 RepID=UPI001FB8997D|nr:hypothetical protein [Methylobacterium sp. J-070]MCJ2049095.1 hypothetical protein [Methylobacterium sp. J-070]
MLAHAKRTFIAKNHDDRAWITSLGRRDARQRLAHLICEPYLHLAAVGLAREHTMPMPLRQPDLADALD